MSNKKDNLIVGLDIGTSKICAIVAHPGPNGLEIVGVGNAPSFGMRKGMIVNIEQTVASIKSALSEAEAMAGCEITHINVGIAGGHIKSFNSQGVIAVKSGEVSKEDIRRVIDAAKALNIPMDREVIHVLPQEFMIDDQDGIKEPLGMSGVRLEAKVHIVTGAVTSAQNIIKSCNKADVDVSDIVLEQIASAEAVLSKEEKEIGVAVVDIGGGTTDIAVFMDGSIKHTAVIALGGDHFNRDIATGLRTPTSDAETIKKAFASCLTSEVNGNDVIDIPSVGGREGRTASKALLCEIVEARMDEILTFVRQELIKSGYYDLLGAGVVLTGGSSLLPGTIQLAEQTFDLPVRLGIPQNIQGLTDMIESPVYATGVGLIIHGHKHAEETRFRKGQRNVFDAITKRMKEWFVEFF